MATSGDDATYQPDNFREQGGRWVIGAHCDVVSGGQLDVESGGSINFASGSILTNPVQSLAKTQVATAIIAGGITVIEASTTGPSYTLAAPVAGQIKYVAVDTNTSAGTAIVLSNTTGVSFTTSGANKITLGTSSRGVTLLGVTTTKWRLAGHVGTLGVSIRTT